MSWKAPGLAFCFVGMVAVGCGNSGGPMYVTPDAGIDSNNKPEAKPDASAPEVAPPMPGDGSKLILGGSVTLIGSGSDSCTNETPATGDRWCGFTKPSSQLGFDELWVINVSKVAAGTTVRCDTTDSNCKRLTSGLFSETDSSGAPSFRIHGFDGDTLIYYAEVGPTYTGRSFVGPVYGWRPGWSRGHKLTSDTGVVCNGHPKAPVAICFEGADITTMQGQLFFELHAGKIGPNDTAPVPLVEKVLTALQNDPEDLREFQADLSEDGSWVGWSARLTAMGPETLKVQKLDDDASRVTVAEDVSRWLISPDQKKWYWLKKFNYDLNGGDSGTLEMANFPAGDGVTPLVEAVGDYTVAGQKGVLVRSGMAQFVGELKLMADRDAPTALKTFDKSVLGVLEQSADGSKAIFVKDVSFDGLTDLFIGSSTASIPCSLSTDTIAIPTGDFVTAGGMVAWARFNELTSTIEGLYTTVGDCRSRKFAKNIGGWTPVSDEGFVYEDEFDEEGLDEAILRYSKVDQSILPTPGVVIQTRASSVYAPLLPTMGAVLYTVATRTAADGLYLNTKLPFTTTPIVTPPDAGTEVGTPPVEAGAVEAGGVDAADAGAPETSASDAADAPVEAPAPDAASNG